MGLMNIICHMMAGKIKGGQSIFPGAAASVGPGKPSVDLWSSSFHRQAGTAGHDVASYHLLSRGWWGAEGQAARSSGV